MTTLRLALAAAFSAIALLSSHAVSAELLHVRLKDRLDRPEDGYCLDIVGTASNMVLDVPLFAHNCKRGPTPDSAVTYDDKGQLVFAGPQVCVTAFGVNDTVLPGTPVLLRPCNFSRAFFDTSNLQKFDHLENGQLQLRGYELCLAVGEESSHTYSSGDRWRVLSMQSTIALAYSEWEMVKLQ